MARRRTRRRPGIACCRDVPADGQQDRRAPPRPWIDHRPHGRSPGRSRRRRLSVPTRVAGARQAPQHCGQGHRSGGLRRGRVSFNSLHPHLHRCFDAFGPERMFWGTDITRMQCSWRQCVTLFTEELPWLKGRDLKLVMGEAVCNWLGWPLAQSGQSLTSGSKSAEPKCVAHPPRHRWIRECSDDLPEPHDDPGRISAGPELLQPAGIVAPSIDDAGFFDAGILPADHSRAGRRQDPDGVLRRSPGAAGSVHRRSCRGGRGGRAGGEDGLGVDRHHDRDGDEPARAGNHLFDDLLRAVSRRASLRDDGSDDQGPGGLEHRDIAQQRGSRQFRS